MIILCILVKVWTILIDIVQNHLVCPKTLFGLQLLKCIYDSYIYQEKEEGLWTADIIGHYTVQWEKNENVCKTHLKATRPMTRVR